MPNLFLACIFAILFVNVASNSVELTSKGQMKNNDSSDINDEASEDKLPLGEKQTIMDPEKMASESQNYTEINKIFIEEGGLAPRNAIVDVIYTIINLLSLDDEDGLEAMFKVLPNNRIAGKDEENMGKLGNNTSDIRKLATSRQNKLDTEIKANESLNNNGTNEIVENLGQITPKNIIIDVLSSVNAKLNQGNMRKLSSSDVLPSLIDILNEERENDQEEKGSMRKLKFNKILSSLVDKSNKFIDEIRNNSKGVEGTENSGSKNVLSSFIHQLINKKGKSLKDEAKTRRLDELLSYLFDDNIHVKLQNDSNVNHYHHHFGNRLKPRDKSDQEVGSVISDKHFQDVVTLLNKLDEMNNTDSWNELHSLDTAVSKSIGNTTHFLSSEAKLSDEKKHR